MSIFTAFRTGFAEGYTKALAPKAPKDVAATAVHPEITVIKTPVAERIGRVAGSLVARIRAIVTRKNLVKVAKAVAVTVAVVVLTEAASRLVRFGWVWLFAPRPIVTATGEVVATVSRGWIAKMKVLNFTGRITNRIRGFHFTKKVVEVSIPVPVV